ncbi:MAG: hypothetical protein IKO22_01995 [Oscillospiraceae bacterium]|nr:hypothetical protein [Oscillospiraceae bacterium]
MQKTYVTRLPDKTGAFLKASQIIDEYGGRIVRANYSRAVDSHTLFIEIQAEPEQHEKIGKALLGCGYLSSANEDSRVIMIVLKIPNRAGALTQALSVLHSHNVNISYVSSQETGSQFQFLKMGILLENTAEIKSLLDDLSQVCETRILDYEVTDRTLDSTVFYVTFTNEMRKLLNLSPEDANCVLIRANKLMQVLDQQDKSSLQTFDYIRRFAKFVRDHKGEHFDVAVSERTLTEDLKLTILEPPCGSNTFVLESSDELMFIDGGYGCFRTETEAVLARQFPGFRERKKTMLITHVDMDHTGLAPLMDTVYMSRNSYEDLLKENRKEKGFREQNPKHTPYFALSEIITRYTPPRPDNFRVIGERRGEELFCPIGSLPFGRWSFDIYEGPGGHVKGEIVAVCEELKLLFSGDIFVNVKGITPEQKEFNRLAPFLLTGVDEDPELSKKAREALVRQFRGYLYCPGHGHVLEM